LNVYVATLGGAHTEETGSTELVYLHDISALITDIKTDKMHCMNSGHEFSLYWESQF